MFVFTLLLVRLYCVLGLCSIFNLLVYVISDRIKKLPSFVTSKFSKSFSYELATSYRLQSKCSSKAFPAQCLIY